MRDSDWKVLMHALSIEVQGIHFSKGVNQEEENAIVDHMIGVAQFIENYRQPEYVQAISDANIQLRKDLEAKRLENRELRELLDTIPNGPGEGMVSTPEEVKAASEWADRYRKIMEKRNCEECGNPCNCKERPAQHLNHLCKSKYHDPGWYE